MLYHISGVFVDWMNDDDKMDAAFEAIMQDD